MAGGGLDVAPGAGTIPCIGHRGAKHFQPGWSTVEKRPPCEVASHATILTCASDHVDGGSADTSLPYGPPPRFTVCVKTWACRMPGVGKVLRPMMFPGQVKKGGRGGSSECAFIWAEP